MPEYPWRGRVRLVPEAYPARSCSTFRREVSRFVGVLLVHPGHAAFDLFQVGIVAVDPYFSHLPTVMVGVEHLDANLLSIGQIGEGLLGALAEVLFFFRRVDLVESDLGQPLVVVEYRQGIAIGNADHATGDAFSMDMDRHNQAEQDDELHDETRAGVKSP